MTRCLDEPCEALVRYGRAVHPEAINGDAMNRPFFRIVPVRSHSERAAGNPEHVGGGRLAGLWRAGVLSERVLRPAPVEFRARCRQVHLAPLVGWRAGLQTRPL